MSSGSTVSFKMTAADQDAVAAWRHLRKEGPEALEKELQKYGRASRKVAQEGKRDGDTLTGSLKGIALQYVSLQAATGMVTNGIQNMIAKMQEFKQLSKDATLIVDVAGRNLQVQGGLSAQARAAAEKQAQALAGKYGSTVEAVGAAQTQLISSGYDTSATENLLKVALASNRDVRSPGDLESIVKSIAKFSNATGTARTPENFLKVGQQVQSLFQGTDIQLGDLANLAKESSSLKFATGADNKQILAAYATAVGSLDPAEAGTSLREFANRTIRLSQSPDQLKALGLKSTDVDFEGESLAEVLKSLSAGLQNVKDPAQRKAMLSQLFGESGAKAAGNLMSPTGQAEFAKNLRTVGDTSGFDAALAAATSGPEFSLRRLQAEQQAILATPKAAREEVFREAYRTELMRDQQGGGGRAVGVAGFGWAEMGIYDAMTTVGMSPESALGWLDVGASHGRGQRATERALEIMERNTRALEANTAAREGGMNPVEAQARAFENR